MLECSCACAASHGGLLRPLQPKGRFVPLPPHWIYVDLYQLCSWRKPVWTWHCWYHLLLGLDLLSSMLRSPPHSSLATHSHLLPTPTHPKLTYLSHRYSFLMFAGAVRLCTKPHVAIFWLPWKSLHCRNTNSSHMWPSKDWTVNMACILSPDNNERDLFSWDFLIDCVCVGGGFSHPPLCSFVGLSLIFFRWVKWGWIWDFILCSSLKGFRAFKKEFQLTFSSVGTISQILGTQRLMK